MDQRHYATWIAVASSLRHNSEQVPSCSIYVLVNSYATAVFVKFSDTHGSRASKALQDQQNQMKYMDQWHQNACIEQWH